MSQTNIIVSVLSLYLIGFITFFTAFNLGWFENKNVGEISTIKKQIYQKYVDENKLTADNIKAPRYYWNEELTPDIECTNDLDCNHGSCHTNPINNTFNYCVCDPQYTDHDGDNCNYHQRSQLVSFLISFLAGFTGAHWYYISFGAGLYIFLGICQTLTCNYCCCGGMIIWILFVINAIPDGNGIDLYPFRDA